MYQNRKENSLALALFFGPKCSQCFDHHNLFLMWLKIKFAEYLMLNTNEHFNDPALHIYSFDWSPSGRQHACLCVIRGGGARQTGTSTPDQDSHFSHQKQHGLWQQDGPGVLTTRNSLCSIISCEKWNEWMISCIDNLNQIWKNKIFLIAKAVITLSSGVIQVKTE